MNAEEGRMGRVGGVRKQQKRERGREGEREGGREGEIERDSKKNE